ncbi:hydrogenase small subunit [Desulfobacter sp. UBA2225]|uniref:hydrogenase small subunit n=1 Tax=Desulfobacter sp. UBA2225 TaxID=1961413 RepID=UPI00257BF8DD|nr:hydrogenase small subunit [Desulfobacter sp. UBA2225]
MINRRDFLKLAACLGASLPIAGFPSAVKAALKTIDPKSVPKLIYLQAQSCTGCSVSLLQAEAPGAVSMITQYSKLVYHQDLSAASGKQVLDLMNAYISGNAGDYFLAVEGSIPLGMPDACVIGGKPIADYLSAAARTMSGAVAIGTCSSYGGIPAAEGNLTGAVSLNDFYKTINKKPLLISIPGCPVHPDWVWKTIVHLVKIGLPELTDTRPAAFFSRKVHELCPRYHDFQQEIFAEKLGDQGCLFKIGCLGPNTFADCPTRWWNSGQTWCIDANAPCIGCSSPMFAKKKDFPFYRNAEIVIPGTPGEKS